MITDEPEVLTWMAVMAPRPRFTTNGRHWWREVVTEAWRCANHAWELEREAYAVGYATEMAEFAELKPRPRLGDFMVHLSQGRLDPSL